VVKSRDRLYSYLSWFDNDRNARTALVGLLVVAFLLRLAAALIIDINFRFEADAVKYVSLARQILNEGVYGIDPGVPDARIPPGYPLFIASIFALTNQSMLAVRLVQVVLGPVIVWLTFLVGQEVASRRIGLLGAFFMAVYPVWVYWTVLFLTETLFTLLLLAFAWCLIRSMKTRAARYAIFSGATFALALLTRETLYMFPLLLPLALWWSRTPWRYVLRFFVLFACAMFLTLSPWLARNLNTFGRAFYTEGAEATLYRLTGTGYLSPYFQYLVDDSIPPPPDKPEEYFERYGRSSDMIRVTRLFTAPATYLRHLVNRFVELWLHPNGLASLPNQLLLQALYVGVHLLILGLAGIGMVTGLRRRDAGTGVLAIILLYFTATSLFFSNPHPRYTLPALPLVFVLTAMGLDVIVVPLKRRAPIKMQTASEV
jgi:4-amino-4-deoxy-L-arabinose transferase-like glycosyltransferase